MNLDEKKEELEREITNLDNRLNNLKEKQEYLKDCFQPSIIQLYNGIDNFITVSTQEGNYEHILGGDGRSRPYSETRQGKIATVKVKKQIYLSMHQKGIVKEYVDQAHKPDHIVFD